MSVWRPVAALALNGITAVLLEKLHVTAPVAYVAGAMVGLVAGVLLFNWPRLTT